MHLLSLYCVQAVMILSPLLFMPPLYSHSNSKNFYITCIITKWQNSRGGGGSQWGISWGSPPLYKTLLHTWLAFFLERQCSHVYFTSTVCKQGHVNREPTGYPINWIVVAPRVSRVYIYVHVHRYMDAYTHCTCTIRTHVHI